MITHVDQKKNEVQGRALVAVRKAVIARHRLSERTGLLPYLGVISRVGTPDRGFYGAEIQDSRRASISLKRKFVRGQRVRQRNLVMLSSDRRDS